MPQTSQIWFFFVYSFPFFFFFFLALRHKAPQINEEQPTGVRCRPPHLEALHVIPNYQKCLFPYLCLVFTVLFHSHQVTRPWKQAEINNFDKNKSQSSRLVPTFRRVDRHHRQKKDPSLQGHPPIHNETNLRELTPYIHTNL